MAHDFAARVEYSEQLIQSRTSLGSIVIVEIIFFKKEVNVGEQIYIKRRAEYFKH